MYLGTRRVEYMSKSAPITHPGTRVQYLEERLDRQTLVVQDLAYALGQMVKHCHPDKPPGLEMYEARRHAESVLKRYTS